MQILGRDVPILKSIEILMANVSSKRCRNTERKFVLVLQPKRKSIYKKKIYSSQIRGSLLLRSGSLKQRGSHLYQIVFFLYGKEKFSEAVKLIKIFFVPNRFKQIFLSVKETLSQRHSHLLYLLYQMLRTT